MILPYFIAYLPFTSKCKKIVWKTAGLQQYGLFGDLFCAINSTFIIFQVRLLAPSKSNCCKVYTCWYWSFSHQICPNLRVTPSNSSTGQLCCIVCPARPAPGLIYTMVAMEGEGSSDGGGGWSSGPTDSYVRLVLNIFIFSNKYTPTWYHTVP
jgi:hypothetical protein